MAGRNNLPKRELYGMKWEPLVDPVLIEMEMIRRGGQWRKQNGTTAGNGLKFHFKRFIEMVWPEHVWHKWNELELDCYLQYRIIGELGPASCVAGHTRILDPITGNQPTIRELYESKTAPTVMTLGGPVVASVPFIKGIDELYEMTLENGERFTATANHRVLTSSGFVCVSEISPGQCVFAYDVCHLESTLDTCLSVPISDAQRLNQKEPDSRFDCRPCSCFCDALPPPVEDACQFFSPSQGDAPKHNAHHHGMRAGVPDNRSARNHHDRHSDRPSIVRTSPLCSCMETPGSHHAFLEMSANAFWNFRSDLPQRSGSFRNSPSSEPCQNSDRTHLSQVSYREHGVQRVAVASVKRVGVGIFYDIQVPDAHHYFAEGAIHHNSGKTHSAAIHSLADYYCFPSCTTVLVSSTEREMLEMRVWGEIKKHHRLAQERFDFIPGNLIESRQRIVSDSRYETSDGRDFRNGICGISAKRGGSYVGLSGFVGVKNKRVRLIADEGHLMPRAYVDSISNLNKNQDFKCIVLGNPKETTDALGIICEPSAELGGWDGGIDQTPKTKTWPTRFNQGICIQLMGSDCPNMDVPETDPVPYPFLITREAIEADIKFYGKDSLQFTMMDEGRMPRGQGLRRVITRQMCLKFGAMEEPIWKNEKQTRIGFLDAAYGAVGGDRCVFGELRFGDDVNDTTILALIDTMLVPVSVSEPELPEDQIVGFVKRQCEQRNIPPENFFFDSTGRGSLVGAMARLWSPYIVPVEFGGKPTDRLVTSDIRVTCRDYYSKFVSELWYSVSLTIQSGQFRGMTEEMMAEGCMREWGFVGANKIEVEPKDKMKLKTGRSPDLFDALVAGVEGARQRGFQIKRMAAKDSTVRDSTWKKELKDRMDSVRRGYTLTYN